MGFGKSLKSLFVEEIEEAPVLDDIEIEESEDVVDVDVDNANRETLISDIYTENGLGELSKSILKVKEVISSLPKEMSAATKRTTVISILSNFGLNATDLAADGENRMDKLSAAMKVINTENTEEIRQKKEAIEEKSKEIEQLEQEVYALEQDSLFCNSVINKEIDSIMELVKFILGGEE